VGSYNLVLWAHPTKDDEATLRIIRRINSPGAIMVPMWDFPVNGPNRETLRTVAEKLADLFMPLSEWNEPHVEPKIGY
jgi:hypothetical protein